MIEIAVKNSQEADIINKVLINSGLNVYQLHLQHFDFEKIYLQLTKN